jgi:NitT/TauT family transport system substrate-binding protein
MKTATAGVGVNTYSYIFGGSAAEFTTTKGLGWIDEGRMQKDYELVQTYLGMERPFPVASAFNNRLLDPSVKMDAGKLSN